MRVFKLEEINRWAHKELISDEKIIKAVNEIQKGLHDGKLGGRLYKKRIAAQGKGKRGGYRMIIAYQSRKNDKFFILHGYAKNDKANITQKEKKAFKELAEDCFAFTDDELTILIEQGELFEVHYD